MKKLICLSLIAFPVLGHALTWGELESEVLSVESGNPVNVQMIRRMSDIVEAIVQFHVALQTAGVERTLFCPASGQEMGLEEIVSMVRHQARLEQSDAEALIPELLINALQREFACS